MIGKRIQEFRKKRGLSLTELAERAGVAKSYLSNVERGIQSNPSVQFLEKVSGVLGVAIEHLIHVEDDTDPAQLDPQWRQLVLDAMDSGISKDEFREFLEFQKWKKSGK